MPVRVPVSLPTLRRKIRRSFLLLTALYALMGLLMMFSVYLAEEDPSLGRKGFLGTAIFFLITLGLSALLGDGLADRLSRPLKHMAETLKEEPEPGRSLHLPVPTTLEMRVLIEELKSLWSRLGEFRQVNIEKMAAQSERLEVVLASVEDAVLVLDNKDTVLQCSEGMLKLLGMKTEDVAGHPWRDLSTISGNYAKLRGLCRAEMSPGDTVELETPKGTRIVAGRRREILTKAGESIGQLYLLHDITERRHRDRVRSEFIGALSNEIRAPLASLGSNVERLAGRREAVDENTRAIIDTVNEDAARLRTVASDLMQVGMTDQPSMKLKLERVALSQILQEWLKPFSILSRDRRIRLEYEQLGADVIMARIDTVKFPWAISNLLANAIRVSQPGNRILVRLNDRVSTEYFHLDVVDEGPGIPEEVQRRMFEPYYQAPEGTSGAATGFLGLGLTIAKEIVEAHDGRIEYFPNKPRGSVFRVKLPT